MKRIAFDIETVGENFDNIDEITKDVLTHSLVRDDGDESDKERLLRDLKDGLGFSPLTGQVVAVGVMDIDSQKGGVYFQSPEKPHERVEEDGITFEAMTEEKILKKFWEIAEHANVFVTFNGRAFDVPFLIVKSAVHGIKPTVNLMQNRYLSYQNSGAVHVDLFDQFSFYGAVRRKGGMHLWCRAFGIKSPKEDGVNGDDVARLFEEGKFLDIAKYNVGDIRATKELFHIWEKYF